MCFFRLLKVGGSSFRRGQMQITRSFSRSKLIIIYLTHLFSLCTYCQSPKVWSHKISSESVQYNRFQSVLIESLDLTFRPFQSADWRKRKIKVFNQCVLQLVVLNRFTCFFLCVSESPSIL